MVSGTKALLRSYKDLLELLTWIAARPMIHLDNKEVAIFARRSIQRMLDENACWMKAGDVRAHVKALNDPSQKSNFLSTVWEVAVLYSLSKCGVVRYEYGSQGESRPDVLFCAAPGTMALIADITTVSDKGREQLWPVETFLREALWQHTKLLRDCGLPSLHVEFGADNTPGRPRRPKIPREENFGRDIFHSGFDDFIRDILREPNEARQFPCQAHECDVTLKYAPQQSLSYTCYPQYKDAHSLKSNPIWNALADKADQLQKSTLAGHRGIILCDGDCYLLNGFPRTWNTFSLDDIVTGFLRQHCFINFVLLLDIKMDVHHRKPLIVRARRYFATEAVTHEPWAQSTAKLEDLMPRPVRTAANAQLHLNRRRRLTKWNEEELRYGGYQMSAGYIKFPARALLELLAGSLSQEDFLKAYSHGQSNIFALKLKLGQLIKAARIEPSDRSEDDDLMVIEFTDPGDPVVSRFRRKR